MRVDVEAGKRPAMAERATIPLHLAGMPGAVLWRRTPGLVPYSEAVATMERTVEAIAFVGAWRDPVRCPICDHPTVHPRQFCAGCHAIEAFGENRVALKFG